ncbi:MAG: caspase family protein, partial [Symploca sp. SIO1A3]|nr:caspase family protein [Symploca sp. SIO1A3]
MTPIKRRQFLQFSGSVLATIGMSLLPYQKSDRLASARGNKPRKLALLVGINNYNYSDRFVNLKGCITDVELQRQLLIHRYGFHPQDILTLTNAQATRQAILQGFEEHLIAQAQPADVVIFHFSGHGIRLTDSDCGAVNCLTSTLVPVDSQVNSDGSVSSITQATLWLLMAALNTENVTLVLDTNYAGWGRDETLPAVAGGEVQLQVSSEEKTYQQQCLSRLGLSPAEFIHRSQAGIPKGVVIAAGGNNQLSAELPFSNFHAGVFTYLMTQHLWQQTGKERVESAIANITRSVVQLSTTDQVPQLAVKPNYPNQEQPTYFLEPQTPPAEAVITKVEGKQVELWLGGLQPKILSAFAEGSLLAIIDQANQEQGLVQLESRQGLVGKGKVLAASPHALQP